MKYLLILLGALALGYLVWKAFIKNASKDLKRSEAEIESLKSQLAGLARELDEKKRSRFNVVELSPIMHLAVLNVDSSFVRTFVREDDKEGITFNGALRAEIAAEYGVKLEEVRFRYDDQTNTLMLSNFHPGFISYSKKRLHWEIARSYRTRSILGLGLPTVSDSQAEEFTKITCEQLRTELEQEIDERKIEEFEWLSPMISQQVTDMLRVIVGKPDLNIVSLESDAGGEFVDFNNFRKQLTE